MQTHPYDCQEIAATNKTIKARNLSGPATRHSMLSAAFKTMGAGRNTTAEALVFLQLLELVPVIRRRLRLKRSFSDDAIMASLKAITRCTTARARAEALFTSELGRHLDDNTKSFQTAMAILLALLPEIKLHG